MQHLKQESPGNLWDCAVGQLGLNIGQVDRQGHAVGRRFGGGEDIGHMPVPGQQGEEREQHHGQPGAPLHGRGGLPVADPVDQYPSGDECPEEDAGVFDHDHGCSRKHCQPGRMLICLQLPVQKQKAESSAQGQQSVHVQTVRCGDIA